MSTLPTSDLQLRAADQRRRLHGTIVELRQTVQQRLDVKAEARRHVGVSSGVAAFFSMFLGYGFAAMFTGRRSRR